MAWIEEVPQGEPDLPAIFSVLSLNRRALEDVKRLNETVAFGSSALTRTQEEAIATVVGTANQCRYGALTHGGFLRLHSEDEGLASSLLDDYTQAELDEADQEMLDFALRLTQRPSSVTSNDVEGLREVGFDDQQILSIVLITCLVNFMNRLADGLGVDVPPSYQRAVEQWLTGPATRQEWLMLPKEG